MTSCFAEGCGQAVGGGRLVRRPPLLSDESLRGYVQRVFDANGVPPIKPMMHSHTKISEAIDWVVEVTGQSRVTLLGRLSLTQHQKGKEITANFAGQLIPSRWISGDQKRVCPKCFRERPYMRIHWEFKVIKRCAVHACRLVDRCSNCSQKLRWSSGELQYCKCGFAIKNLAIERANREMVEGLYFNALRVTLRGECRRPFPTRYSRSVSDPIYTVARITELLGTKYLKKKAFDGSNSPLLRLISDEQGHPPNISYEWAFKGEDRLARSPTGLEASCALIRHCGHYWLWGIPLRPYHFPGDFADAFSSEVLGLAIRAEPLVYESESVSGTGDLQFQRRRSKAFLQSPWQLWSSMVRMWNETIRQDLSA